MGSTLLWLVVSGLVTGLGGLALAVVRHPGPRLDTPLGATAGIMLAAVVFSLLVPPLEDGSVWEVVAGFAVAAALLAALAATIPHVRERIVERTLRREEHRAALMLGALAIDDLPEGLAVGVAFGVGGAKLGVRVAAAIAVQNVPGRFAAASPVHALGAARGAPGGVARVRPRRGDDGRFSRSLSHFRQGRWSTSSSARSSPRATVAGTNARRLRASWPDSP